MKRPNRAQLQRGAALVLLVLFVACVQGIRAPEVSPRGTLGAAQVIGGEEDTGPLAIVFASPEGKLRGPAEVTVLFNKPMRELAVAGTEKPFPGRIEPAIAGSWHWTGTRAASFIPERADGGGAARLPAATSFRVSIPAGTLALDGDRLAEEYSFSFETERPEITASPYSGARNLRPDAQFHLYSNQPVDLAELTRVTSFQAGGKPVPFTLKADENQADRRFVLIPGAPLPLDTALTLNVTAELRGKDGPLPAASAAAFTFRTAGPLVASVRCYQGAPDKKCAAGSGITVELSNPVLAKDLKRVLSIEPAVKLRLPQWIDDSDHITSVNLDVGFRPGQAYTVRVAAGLTDNLGQRLASTTSQRVEFGDLWPLARIGMGNGVFEASGERDFTVAHINSQDLEIGTVALGEDDIFALEEGLANDKIRGLSGYQAQKVGKGRKNVRELAKQSISKILGSDKARGAFAVTLRYTSRGREQTDRSVGQLTNLGITAKVSTRGSLVWVTELSSGAPVKDAEVVIKRKGQPGASARTDAMGMVSISAAEFKPKFDDEKAIVFVKKADDKAYLPVADTLYTAFDSGNDETLGMMFSDRRIYRPGDVAHIKGIVRQPTPTGSRPPPAGVPVTIELEGPGGETLQKLSATTSAFGTYSVDVKVPAETGLGTHWLTAKINGDSAGSDELEVAEYRPAEFKVSVESNRPSYVRGAQASWTMRGDYLYGAPMAGSSSEVYVQRSSTSFSPKGTSGFTTSDRPYYADLRNVTYPDGQLLSSRAKLDAQGSASASSGLVLPGMRGPETLTAYLDVSDVTRQTISSSTSAIVHPAAHYAALGVTDWFVPQGSPVTAEAIAVAPDGTRLTDKPLKVSFISRKWTTAKQKSGSGVATTVTEVVDTVAHTCELKSAKQPVRCAHTPSESGYYIVRVESADDAKNPVSASREVYVTGSGGARYAHWDSDDQDRVSIVRDKEHYAIGDVAKLLVKSPYQKAEALLTIEKDGILEQRRVTLVGATPTLSIPVTEAMRPNAYVSLMILNGRNKPMPKSSDQPDVGAPDYKLAYTQLLTDPEDKRLTVSVAPVKTDYRPGEEVIVDLGVADRKGNGKASELTVYAIDEGVLSLVGYTTPDPVPVFGAPRPLRVATLESRQRLTRFFDPLSGVGLDKGDDGGGGGEGAPSGARRDFRAAAYFNGSVATDAQGKAQVRFKLPDSLTSYRIMAVAVSKEDFFGKGDANITSSRPLMARPALPRFLRAGDTFDASIVISSKELSGDFEVTAAASGVALAGDKTQRVALTRGQSVEVRFPATAQAPGNARFTFTVKGAGASDTVVMDRKVALPLPPETVALYGATQSAAAEKLGDFSKMRSDTGELVLTTSSTALVGLDVGASQLLDYPYGCTEQLASRLVPLVAMRDLAKDFSLPLPANLDDVVEKTVAKLLTHQRHDGSFGFWAESAHSHPVATAYAIWTIGLAQKAGYRVPKHAMESGLRALRGMLSDRELESAMGPFVVYVLADLGQPDAGRNASLFEQREQFPAYSKAFLLSALALSKGEASSIEALVKDLEALVRLDGPVARIVENTGDSYRGYLDSEARTTAVVLRALLHARPNHPLSKDIAKSLLGQRQGGTWRTTQESAWALLALGDYRRVAEKTDPNMTARVFLGENLISEREFAGRSTKSSQDRVPMSSLAQNFGAPLSFAVEGQGTLHYEARLQYVRKELPTDVIDRGFYVEKKLRRVTPDTLQEALSVVPNQSASEFSGGDLVLVDVVVVTPKPRSLVAIDDPLPAGFEAVDMRLSTSSDRLRLDSYAEDEDGNGYSSFVREVRDDRVLFFVDHMPAGVYRYRYLARATAFGTFITPPTRAEEMYTPEIFGRTSAGTVKILAQSK